VLSCLVFSIFVQELEVRLRVLEEARLADSAGSAGSVTPSNVWNNHDIPISLVYPWNHIADADAILDFFVCPELNDVDIKEKGGGGVTVHSIWKREQNKWNEHHRGLQLYFEQKVIYKSLETPDCCGAPFGVALTPLTVQLVGELKGRRARAHFEDAECGQLLSYMLKTRKYQGLWHARRWYGGFLSDGHFIMLLWCVVEGEAEKWFRSDVLSLADEGTRRVFFGLLGAVIEQPRVSFDGEAVLPKQLLGEGATSHVFCVAWRGKDCVLKRFRPNCERFYHREVANLTMCAAVLNITKLISKDDGIHVLLLSPVGTPFRDDEVQLTKKILMELIDAVDAVHKCGLVHRDIKFENMFVGPTGCVLLNDFGHAVSIGAEETVGGCIQNSCDRVLRAEQDKRWYVAAESDDWVMLLRMCWRKLGRKRSTRNAAALLDLYSAMERPWKEFQSKLELGCTVDEIKAFFSDEWLVG